MELQLQPTAEIDPDALMACDRDILVERLERRLRSATKQQNRRLSGESRYFGLLVQSRNWHSGEPNVASSHEPRGSGFRLAGRAQLPQRLEQRHRRAEIAGIAAGRVSVPPNAVLSAADR
jgi:hypothetical protein